MVITDSVVDKLIESISTKPAQWYLDKDLIFNSTRIFIGNFDSPESLIIHIGDSKFGVTKNTITKQQAERLASVIVKIRDFSAATQINDIMSQL